MFGGGGGGGGLGGGSALSFTEARDTEALIILEVTYVSALCPSQQGAGALLVASVQFNTLDIIGEWRDSWRPSGIPSFAQPQFKTIQSSFRLVTGQLEVLFLNHLLSRLSSIQPYWWVEEQLEVPMLIIFCSASILCSLEFLLVGDRTTGGTFFIIFPPPQC